MGADFVVCPVCNQEIDPEVCFCGAEKKYHGRMDNHSFIPAGCICNYSVSEKETSFDLGEEED